MAFLRIQNWRIDGTAERPQEVRVGALQRVVQQPGAIPPFWPTATCTCWSTIVVDPTFTMWMDSWSEGMDLHALTERNGVGALLPNPEWSLEEVTFHGAFRLRFCHGLMAWSALSAHRDCLARNARSGMHLSRWLATTTPWPQKTMVRASSSLAQVACTCWRAITTPRR